MQVQVKNKDVDPKSGLSAKRRRRSYWAKIKNCGPLHQLSHVRNGCFEVERGVSNVIKGCMPKWSFY
uniref:Ribosomal protein S14 n=1 Tax=Peronospora matthiolae TaxID=2874970 RepID=A0AAV1TJW0_9STRA